jgi:hypothetical protein
MAVTIKPKDGQTTLTNAQKRFVVEALATGHGVTEVARALKEIHHVEITPQSVSRYHPLRVAGQSLSPELKKLFFDVRAKVVDEIEKADLAHVSVRLKRLDDLYEEAMSKGQLKTAVVVLTEARKIMDGFIEVDEPTQGEPVSDTPADTKGDEQ